MTVICIEKYYTYCTVCNSYAIALHATNEAAHYAAQYAHAQIGVAMIARDTALID